jgi:hypothetical protein
MRDLCALECNQNLAKAMDKGEIDHIFHTDNVNSVEKANAFLDNITLEMIAEKISLYDTAWYLSEPAKDVKYHSIAGKLVRLFHSVFSRMSLPLEADILSIKEKALGFDRTKTIKILLGEETVCYITANVQVCDVPKKQHNSTGKGIRLVSISVSRENTSIGQFLDERKVRTLVIENWLKEYTFAKINGYMYQINNGKKDAISKLAMVTKEYEEEMMKLA